MRNHILKNRIILTVFILILLFIFTLISLGKIRIFSVNRYGQFLNPDSPSVLRMLTLLNAGEILQPEHYIVSIDGKEIISKGQAEDAVRQLKELEPLLEKCGAYEFVDGRSFKFNKEPYRAICPMKDETMNHLSAFTLPPVSSRQDYLILKATDLNQWQTTLHCLMCPTDNGWQVLQLWVKQTRQDYPTFREVLASAKEQDNKDNLLLAGALYNLCNKIAMAAPFRVTGKQHIMQPAVSRFAKKVSKATSLDTLTTSKGTYDIIKVETIEFPDGSYLGIWYNLDKLKPDEEMKIEQKILATACLERYPEITEYYTGIAVHAQSMDKREKGRGYRLTFSNQELLNK